MIKNLSGLLAVFLVVTLLAGISLVYPLATPTDNLFSIVRTDTDGFTILQKENDQDDFKNYIVSNDGSVVYFKAQYTANQNYGGSKGVALIYLNNDDKADRIGNNSITEMDQFIFLDQDTLLFDGGIEVDEQNVKGLYKADLTAKTITTIREGDTLSSIITKDLFIGATDEKLFSVDKNYQVTKTIENANKKYFPLAFSKDYDGEINMLYYDKKELSIGQLDKSKLDITFTKKLEKSDSVASVESESITFYHRTDIDTIAVTSEGNYTILFKGKPTYQTTINGNKIVGNKQSLYIHLNKKLEKIDGVVSLFIHETSAFYIKEGNIHSFTVSADNILTDVGAIYTGGDAADILTLNNGNLIFKTCSVMSTLCSVKRMDEKQKAIVLIEDNDNEDKGAWDYLLVPLKYPKYEFVILAHADSSNPVLLKFLLKPPVTCYGVNNTDSDVCNGNGECIAENACKCFGNFAGDKCDKCTAKFEGKNCNEPKIHKCYGISSNSSNVCRGPKRGQCISENNCECKAEYFGNECEHTYCFGVPSISETGKVCGGKGACVDYNDCKCEEKYSGSICEFYESVLVSDRALYPIMITYGVTSLVTVIGLLMLVFCFLGRHRKEYLALYGNRTIISHDDTINGEEEDEELNEQNFLERETQEPVRTTPKPQGQEYALDESDEDL